MRRFLVLFLCLATGAVAAPQPPAPETLAVIYNASQEKSKALAETYAEARDIPADNLVGLPLPDTEQISRQQYNELIRDPLIAEFDRRAWWRRQPDADGNLLMRQSKIRVLCTMRGVPSRVRQPAENAAELGNKQRIQNSRSASVDAELAMLGVEGQPLKQGLNNPYFRKDVPIAEARIPIFLVGRIDAHTFAVCERMIRDAVAAEETGLWGMGVIDIAQKDVQGAPMGDPWLETIAGELSKTGIPVLVDRFSSTLPLHFPLRDTALYYGWYDGHVSGPFKNRNFRFKRGAVAVHIHSFSASQLRNAGKNWCAPLLAKGAAATLGNVYEPFLHLTHHLDVFNDRLLKGYTLVEAAHMALPALSWQAVVLGDPLYRPFAHLDGTGKVAKADSPFRAYRIARTEWTESQREKQLREAAERMGDGTLLEALALDLAAREQYSLATDALDESKALYDKPADRIRIDMFSAMIHRKAGRTAAAIETLRDVKETYPTLREVESAVAWLDVLDPPAPPAAGNGDE